MPRSATLPLNAKQMRLLGHDPMSRRPAGHAGCAACAVPRCVYRQTLRRRVWRRRGCPRAACARRCWRRRRPTRAPTPGRSGR
eukprot:3496999-Pleurochrysis_carterae.AAC.1